MRSSPEEGQTDAPTLTISNSSCSDAARTGSSREGNGSSFVDNRKKADGEHPGDPEREDGKWMRTEGNRWKTVEEQEESMLRKTVKYLKMLERTEAKIEANEEEVERIRRSSHFEEEGADLDPEQVRQGREEEMNHMVKILGMFELGSWKEATLKAGKAPTTNEMDRPSEEGRRRSSIREMATCGARFQTKTRGPRDDLFAATRTP